jgi:hypothetical protein
MDRFTDFFSMADLRWSGYDRLIARLGAIAHPDANPLMLEFEKIITEDNRDGALRGVDRYDVPYIPVTYRPKVAPAPKPTRRQRNNAPADRRGVFAGLGPHVAGTNNNLTSAEYRRLGGKPLDPRGPNSRIITNLGVGHDEAPSADGVWLAYGRWVDVVSTTGYAFLHDLFTGKGRFGSIPARDPRGVRKAGRAKALTAAKAWLVNVVKGNP